MSAVQPRKEESELTVIGAERECEPPVKGGGDSEALALTMGMDKERQIPVDPVSLRHLGMVADEDSPLSAPSVLTEVVVQSPMLPPLRRPNFVGASLPCSATSSPVHRAAEKREEPVAVVPTPSPTAALRALSRQHYSVALAHHVAAPASAPALSRSSSRAEGRSMVPHDEDAEHKPIADHDDSFNCSALCMFIPGFSKKKPASAAAAVAVVSNMQRQQSGERRRSSLSRMASLERFECGSWSPPPPVAPAHEVAKTSCADDTEAPVKMAFVFDHDEPRGILKKSASSRQESASRPSTSSQQRHVRFSTATAASCPTSPCPTSPCVTPRLARARAEFNAFLQEAQST
ncbi:hypothetical protein GUJ93_ZPchr0006g41520 [Zizania palustris]|uniref:Uncharacterized protein n=1 Tax=Zizania palustris TaxID=103762 RepID=A0A8J5TBN9_ZIZPA|nr:hypothetical protein GUJ93_ZPchr0006g43022 [Zizania palustris]KAG8075444.1 hypothetical protein GUJ93_ZPchr0006g41520 [Zizania palustris]